MRMRALAAILAAGMLFGGSAAVAIAQPGPNGNNNKGLCTAYFNGSEKGQEKKRQAQPFQALEEAAGDDGVEEFCNGLVGGRAGRDG